MLLLKLKLALPSSVPTAMPELATHRTQKRSRDGTVLGASRHRRWLEDQGQGSADRFQDIASLGELPTYLPEGTFTPCSLSEQGLRWNNAPQSFSGDMNDQYLPGVDYVSTSRAVQLDFIIGDPENAALYSVQDEDVDPVECFTVQEVKDALIGKQISSTNFKEYLLEMGSPEYRIWPAITSASALCTMREIYEHLPGSRIAIKVADMPLYQGKWVSSVAQVEMFSGISGPRPSLWPFRLNVRVRVF